ncbi:organic cation transporter-like protein isoform X2 [Ischnura elegans]|nr:organic cation transporter-like protein isoform X2 [Ischnura elegans]
MYFDESSFTVTGKWDMICDREHLVPTYQYLYHFGRFLGSLLFGIWSDRRGRCIFLNWCILCQPVFGLLAISSSNYNIFIFAQTFLGICVGGAFTLSLVYIVEVSGPKTCAKLGTFAFLSICLSSFSLSFIHVAMCHWHYMQIFMTVPLVIFALWREIFEESPRWLLVMQRPEDALLAMKLIAHRNKLLISPYLKLRSAAESDFIGEEDDDRNCNIWDVRNYPNLRIVIALLVLLHFGLATILQVRTLRFTALRINVHILTALMGFIELVSIGCTIYFTPIIGHTKLTCIAMAAYGFLNLFLLIFVHSMISEDYVMYMVLASICYFLVVMSFASINVYSCRVLPTIIRGSGFGLANSISSFGMLFATFVSRWSRSSDVKVFILIFSLLSFLTALVAYILPETSERELPDTLRDGEHFQRRPRPRRWIAEEPGEETERKVVLRPSSLRTESENERSVPFKV